MVASGSNADGGPRDGAGDAAAVQRRLEAWLAQRGAARAPDWEGVLTQLRAALARIDESALVQSDPSAQDLLVRMIAAADMEELSEAVDRLGERVAELLASRAPRQQPLRTVAELELAREPIEVPSRMFLKL